MSTPSCTISHSGLQQTDRSTGWPQITQEQDKETRLCCLCLVAQLRANCYSCWQWHGSHSEPCSIFCLLQCVSKRMRCVYKQQGQSTQHYNVCQKEWDACTNNKAKVHNTTMCAKKNETRVQTTRPRYTTLQCVSKRMRRMYKQQGQSTQHYNVCQKEWDACTNNKAKVHNTTMCVKKNETRVQTTRPKYTTLVFPNTNSR